MKKTLAMILAAVMLLALAACGTTAEETSAPPSEDAVVSDAPAEESEAPSEPAEAQYLVGICQQMTHDALDAATQGFKDALTDILGEGAVEYSEGNAGGEQPNCMTIIDGLVSEGVDLILANATWPLQAAASATADIPILGTSVTDYATALNIDDWTGTVGGNISGTSDLAPLDQQADMIQELFPDANERRPALLLRRAQQRLPDRDHPRLPRGHGLHLRSLRLHRRQRPQPPSPRPPATTPTSSTSPPTTPPPATPRPSPTSSSPRASPSSPVRAASAPAAAWPPSPSATTTLATPPARWPRRSSRARPTSPPCPSSTPRTSPRCTTPPTARRWASPSPMTTPLSRAEL